MARPKQERAVRTKQLILHAAAEVFDECGYSGTSISRILERAGSTQGAMYFHFKSKEDLARAVIVNQAEELKLPADPAGLQQLVDITLHLAHELQRNVLLRAGVRLAVEQEESGLDEYSVYEWWINQFRRELDVARERGELLPEVDEAEFAAVLVASFTGTQVMSQVATRRADLPERIASLWRYLLPGLAPAEVRQRLMVSVERGQAPV
ncbi:branched-chain amino acid aminotransferase [Streptomyces sp. MMG1533]|uniref:ScbR family autoregulator-binding transcription factor n=1 Tax=Streptomyces sp. MMG1533 TaxID=1415546 RepID=UPI0003C9529E|nr:ScbR family autoregulator-binding transcription factor [Streptomyces sp. MMG1533]AGZ94069.1 butyrolactone receptor [Streptomyces sp. MMG1533]KOU60811.1 branched-chain amino acid aminotransferase [Streptomyces sp. MMG1533]